ncbi:MAG: hypothetical protein ABI378_02580 [Chitinophagaceae bacterium]
MSIKLGSSWNYGAKSGVEYTRFARDKDTLKDGLTFSYFERLDTSNNLIPEYFGKNSGYYFTLIDLDGSETNYLPYAFWKDSASKGTSWNNTGSVSYPSLGKVPILIESTEVDDNVTLYHTDSTYKNLIHVHSNIKATLSNLRVGTLDIWFRKGLGVVRQEADISILGAFKLQYTDSLLHYHIEP